jgi:hypothetical protein
MKDNGIERNMSILAKNGRIETISPVIQPPEGEHTIIEGNNKYIIPGLINAHTHLGDNPDDLILYLANGVTTIRNMWGYENFHFMHWLFGTRVFSHLELKNEVSSGNKLGPNIFTPGPILDGNPPFFPKFMYVNVITNHKDAERIVRYQSEKGYDFIKIY